MLKNRLDRFSLVSFVFAFCSPILIAQTNILLNPGFEQISSGVPTSWTIDNRTAGGSASALSSGKHGGNYALALSWTPTRSTGTLSAQLGAGQAHLYAKIDV